MTNTTLAPHDAVVTRDSVLLGRIGAGLIVLAGILHGVLAPEYLDEHPFYGVLFIVSVPLSLLVGWWLWQTPESQGAARRRTAWYAGLALALGMAAAFVLSRTTGLPGFSESEWDEGVPSLLTELAFVGVAAVALTPRRTARS